MRNVRRLLLLLLLLLGRPRIVHAHISDRSVSPLPLYSKYRHTITVTYILRLCITITLLPVLVHIYTRRKVKNRFLRPPRGRPICPRVYVTLCCTLGLVPVGGLLFAKASRLFFPWRRRNQNGPALGCSRVSTPEIPPNIYIYMPLEPSVKSAENIQQLKPAVVQTLSGKSVLFNGTSC